MLGHCHRGFSGEDSSLSIAKNLIKERYTKERLTSLPPPLVWDIWQYTITSFLAKNAISCQTTRLPTFALSSQGSSILGVQQGIVSYTLQLNLIRKKTSTFVFKFYKKKVEDSVDQAHSFQVQIQRPKGSVEVKNLKVTNNLQYQTNQSTYLFSVIIPDQTLGYRQYQ